jgi:hypothetical protein
VPKIELRKIHENKHGDGDRYTQFILTIPKEFAKRLKAKGISSLYVMYGERVLIAFSSAIKEEELTDLLKLNIELEKLLAKEV